MKTNELYSMAIDRFGIAAQCVVAVEELSELQKEICKQLRGGGDLNALSEEIADAKIMIEQIIKAFGIKQEAEEWRRLKLERLERRLYDA